MDTHVSIEVKYQQLDSRHVTPWRCLMNIWIDKDWRDISRLFDGMQQKNESVTLTNFIMDCSKLRGGARNFDIVCLQKVGPPRTMELKTSWASPTRTLVMSFPILVLSFS
eukprot:2545653-Amphidinium_carterae.1